MFYYVVNTDRMTTTKITDPQRARDIFEIACHHWPVVNLTKINMLDPTDYTVVEYKRTH